MAGRLRRYDHAHFNNIMSLVKRALEIKPSINKLIVDMPENVPDLENLDLSNISFEMIQTCIRGNTLDLRGIHLRLQGYQAHIDHVFTRPEISLPEYEQLEDLVEVLSTAKETFREMSETAAPEQVFGAINGIIKLLDFRNVSIYSPGRGGRWSRVFVSTPWAKHGTKYDPGEGGAVPTTTLKSVIDGSKRYYVVDINDPASFERQGLTADPVSIENDLSCSHGPSEMIFIKVFSPSSGQLVGVVQINDRAESGQPVRQTLLPSEPTAANKVLTLLETIFDEAALAVERTLRVTARRSIPSCRVLPAVSRGFDLFGFIKSITVPRTFGRYQVASIIGPSKLSGANIRGIIETIDWMERGEMDMQVHAIRVDETRFAFDDEGQVVGFASINSLPYVYRTSRGREKAGSVIPLVGTAVKQEHRRQGLQTALNFHLILKRWVRLKLSWNMFKPLRVAARTYNPAVMAALYTHFRHIKFNELSLEEAAARAAFARHLKCEVDQEGVVRNAYEEPLPDPANGVDLTGRVGRRVAEAKAGLGERDARIFILKYTFVDILKTVLWLSYKGLKRWWSRG